MKITPSLSLVSLALLAGVSPLAQGQTRSFSVGYVYPAGAKQGTTTEHVIAGQNVRDALGIDVTGGGITAEIVEIIRPISGSELNQLRIQMDDLVARRAVVKKDDNALENFRSFKNAKEEKAVSSDEIEDLKKKYANATWTAEDEKMLAEVRRRISSGVRKPANPAICELVVCRLTVAPDALPNKRELRLRSAQGLSNPLVFYVGQWAEFSDPASKNIAEQKSAVAKIAYGPKGGAVKKSASKIELPCVINGQILPGEVDHWRFEAKEGDNLVISVKARQLIPYISDAVPGWFQATLSLFDSSGRELAYRDDFRFDPDPVLHYSIPANGEYEIQIKDSIYRGREDFVYRVTVGDTPFITFVNPLGGPADAATPVEVRGWNLPSNQLTFAGKGKEPGIQDLYVVKEGRVSNFIPFDLDTLPECSASAPEKAGSSAQALNLPVIVNGCIAKPNADAAFSFPGKAGTAVVAEVMARRLNSPLDSTLSLAGPDGKEVAFNDDNLDRADGLTTHHADSYLRVTLPKDGTYRLRLSDAQHRGGKDYVYRLRVSPPRPDFELRAVPSSINIRAGSSVPLTVHALRRDGFEGDITLRLKNAPDGFDLSGETISGKAESAKVNLTAPWRAMKDPVSLEIEGWATIDGREVTRKVVPAEDRMQAFSYRHFVPSDELRVAVIGGKDSDLRVVCAKPLRLPAGGTAKFKIQDSSSRIAKARLTLSKPPEGVAIKQVSKSSEGVEVTLEIDSAKAKRGLKGNLLVTASLAAKKKDSSSKNSSSRTLPAIPFVITGQ